MTQWKVYGRYEKGKKCSKNVTFYVGNPLTKRKGSLNILIINLFNKNV